MSAAMLGDVAGLLTCPTCGQVLAVAGGSLACASGHTHDIAREGYVNLLAGARPPGTADTSDMVASRAAFLARGLYDPIADAVSDAVCAAVPTDAPGALLEIGAGTAYYLAAALDAAPGRLGIALDVSKYAARRAARAHPRAAAVVADTWASLPLRDGCAAAVLDVFAPRNAPEIARVLAPGGALVVVTPTAAHLAELVAPLGLITVDADKDARLAAQLGPLFELVRTASVQRTLALDRTAVRELVAMGPSARHTTGADLDARLAAIEEPLAATLSVEVATYAKRDRNGA